MSTRAARGAGKAATERFVILLRAGEFSGAGIRLPVRVSGPAAHGNHSGATGAEFNLDLITTAPGVRYKIPRTDGEVIEVDNPSRWLDPSEIEKVEEPVILATILTNEEYVGGILKLVEEKRGKQKTFEYVSSSRVMLQYELPLNEIVLDFYDRLKSVSRGYASLDYHLTGTWESPMAKLDIMVAGEPVDALSTIIHRDVAYERGKALVSKMKQLIPRQMFEVAIQAAIGAKIIARETVPAMRKNVLAKCYGGDISRKRKLLEKAERRQEADEADRARGYSAGSVSGGAEGGGKRVERSQKLEGRLQKLNPLANSGSGNS